MSPAQPESGTQEFSCVPRSCSPRISLLPTEEQPSLKICAVEKPPTVCPRQDARLRSSRNRPQRKILIAGSDAPPNLLCSLVKNMFPCISSSSVLPPERFTTCRLSATCAVFQCVHTLQEEKYVGSELILFLTYREIPVVFNLDDGIQELYREEKRMCSEQKCVRGVPYCFVAGILDDTEENDKHII